MGNPLSHQELTSEGIRQRLTEGGESARWLAQAVVSYYRPGTPGPCLTGYSTRLDEEARALFRELLEVRSHQDWDDEALALLARECELHLANGSRGADGH